jgi:nucleotide-binding universal stress UspA family protein
VLDAGARLARLLAAQVALVYVVDTSLVAVPEAGIPAAELLTDLEAAGQEVLQRRRNQLPPDMPVETFEREGRPADELLAAARAWQADLIVMGAHAHSRLERLLLSSTTAAVVEHAPCPVLTVPTHPPGR